MFNMVKGHHFRLTCYPLLFHTFKRFNIKATTGHHSVSQKDKDEVLAKDAIDPLVGGAGYTQISLQFPSVLVVYDLHSILRNLIATSIYLLLKCLLSDMHANSFNKVIIIFPLM